MDPREPLHICRDKERGNLRRNFCETIILRVLLDVREPSLLWTGACSRKPDETNKLREVGEAPGGGGGEGRGGSTAVAFW